jgi:uncharacterized protein (TIGR02391 family)
MGRYGGATQIEPEQDQLAQQRWHLSDLLPVTGEQATGVAGTEKSKMFMNFCPEVMFERFGWFATFLSDYADEIDRESAYTRLKRIGADHEDWRWVWSSLRSMHYTECRFYSLLQAGEAPSGKAYREITSGFPPSVTLTGATTAGTPLDTLHPEIRAKCAKLFEDGSYPEAVEKGFKIVRDRLRAISGEETGSKAFGVRHLHVQGAAAPNVDRDFNEAVKFLTMAIDFFRNEKSHTSDGKIDNSVRAYEYLSLSSLALNLLEETEIL